MIALAHVERGWVGVRATERGIAACTLPCATVAQALLQMGAIHVAQPPRLTTGGQASAVSGVLHRALRDLRRFFAGERVALRFPLDLSGLPEFTCRVLLTVAGIPYGETRTYGEVARRAGNARAARAVGQVMARNPLALIVPCHRVIGGDGRLVGFGGGLDLKRGLLALEGAAVAPGEC
jgi:methylated-DNA-[protein]-cysteine S-methyltransferase